MGAFFTLGALVLFIFCYQACAHVPGPNSEYSASLGPKSVIVYTQKVEPVLATQCAQCHTNRTSPYFMTGNAKMNHDTLTDFALVSLGVPDRSRLVTKIRSGHEGIPIEFADEIQQVIALWAQGILPSEIMSPFERGGSVLATKLRRPLVEYIAGADAGANPLVMLTEERQVALIREQSKAAIKQRLSKSILRPKGRRKRL